MSSGPRARARARSVTLALLFGLALSACGGTQGPSVRGAGRNDAIIYINANVKDAGLYVDGTFIAGLDALRGGIAVKAGAHRLEVRHDDYFAYYEELVVKAGERRTLAVELAPVLP